MSLFHCLISDSCLLLFRECLQAVDLQKLILAHNSIVSLKEDLRNLSSLSILNVSHNELSQLPAAIGEYVVIPTRPLNM